MLDAAALCRQHVPEGSVDNLGRSGAESSFPTLEADFQPLHSWRMTNHGGQRTGVDSTHNPTHYLSDIGPQCALFSGRQTRQSLRSQTWTGSLDFVGTVEEIVLRILSYEAVGLDELLPLPDLEHRDADTDAFARQVLPVLRSV